MLYDRRMKKGLSETASPYGGVVRKTPGVCGGDACIRGTRIPVWLLVELRRNGASDAAILDDYPGLQPDDLAAAWAYYESNRAEIDAAIADERS
jgi:type III restriction enzyme